MQFPYRPNLALDDHALYPVSCTSDEVLKLAAHRWQQLHNGVRRVGLTVGGLDCLPQFEPMVGHASNVALHRITRNRAKVLTLSCYTPSVRTTLIWLP